MFFCGMEPSLNRKSCKTFTATLIPSFISTCRSAMNPYMARLQVVVQSVAAGEILFFGGGGKQYANPSPPVGRSLALTPSPATFPCLAVASDSPALHHR